MTTKYDDKTNRGPQSYFRRDYDATEGGAGLVQDAFGVDEIIFLEGPEQFRDIRTIGGVTTISARVVKNESIPLLEEKASRSKPLDGPVPMTEEFSGSFGFGGGIFGQGGFGGTLP